MGRITPAGVETMFQTPVGFPGATPGHCADARDGGMWCGSSGPIVRVSVTTGAVSTFPLPPGSIAADLTLGPDGALWFTDPLSNQIGRLTLTGAVTEYPLPSGFFPHSITVGPDGALWFSGNGVGRLDTGGRGFLSYKLPNPPEPNGSIAAGPDGSLWLGAQINYGQAHSVVRVGVGGQVSEFPLTNPASTGVVDIVQGPDGAMWFTDEGANEIGRITTAGSLTAFALPQPQSEPVGITVGRDGAIWFTEVASRLGRLSGGPLAATPIPALSPMILFVLAAVLCGCGWLLLHGR